MSLNHTLFFTLFDFASGSGFFSSIAVFFAEYMQYVIAFMLAGYIAYQKQDFLKRVWQVAVAGAAGILSRVVVKGLIVHFAPSPRPFIALPEILPLIAKDTTEAFQSFPSGHAIFFFAISTVIFYYHRKLGVVLFTLSLFMGIGRVMVGVHFPVDILGGIILGVLVGIIATSVARLLTEKVNFFKKFA